VAKNQLNGKPQKISPPKGERVAARWRKAWVEKGYKRRHTKGRGARVKFLSKKKIGSLQE